jgi:membrane associated rhomboid family serine protease
VTSLLFLVIVAVVAFRLTTGVDRAKVLRKGVVLLRELVLIGREEYDKLGPFRGALRARTRFATLTIVLAAGSVVYFILLLFGAGSFSDPATLVSWGANFGPRTTNGEWWRLLSSTFVHVSLLRMMIEVAALAQLGVLLERLIGRAAFGAVFCLAGILAALINLSAHPITVTGGTSGALAGLYGLLLAIVVREALSRRFRRAQEIEPLSEPGMPAETDPELADGELAEQMPALEGRLYVPRAALLWLVPLATALLLSALLDGQFVFRAVCASLVLGFAAGLVLAAGVAEQVAPRKPVLVTAGVLLAALVAFAVPLRGIADVRPEIARIIALEDRTADTYATALGRLRKGALTAEGLAQLIDRSIVPELEAADAHLRSIHGEPPEHQPLVANADEYLRLRTESWKLYAEDWRNQVKARRRGADAASSSDAGWHQVKAQFRADAATRGRAEGTERASLEALQRLK